MDFVIEKRDKIAGIEVKSGPSYRISGITPFQKQFRPWKIILVGRSGIPWEEFLNINPLELS